MYLLYLDDSGSVGNVADTHVILAGVALFERLPFWFSKRLDEIAAEIWPSDHQALEFRGGDIVTGRKKWRSVAREKRVAVYEQTLDILAHSRDARLFGAVVHKAAVSPDDPIEFAFEQLCNRFDRFLGRLHRSKDTHRGLIVLDESSYETSLQRLARDFRVNGHRWGRTHNLAEVPLFVNSRATRMIQLADLVAYALRQYYERGNSRFFDRIATRFDAEGGVVHGLVHSVPADSACNCFACRQRRKP